MAIYDGFFDAEAVGENEDGATKYDREYGPDDFTGYFANIIGSGVCVHENPDSFKVRLEEGAAVVSPGYLFIQGYWLKNDGDYTVPLSGSSTLAVLAHLNLGARMIQLEARSMAQSYPDSLVLALVNPAAGTVEDTRYNTDICGVIETAGDLSGKVEDAINFIDNEVKDKLAQAEADINAQAARLDAKIAEVQAVADRISPPPIGSIKFSASQDVDDEWLRCDGSFVSEADYPDLVAALGKLTPSGDKFQLISEGEVGQQISNGVIYGGRMWVYSYSNQKLYGISLDGNPMKEISVTSDDSDFLKIAPPTTASPLALSIVPSLLGGGAKLFLSQLTDSILIFSADFTADGETVSMVWAFDPLETKPSIDSRSCVPYVISRLVDGVEQFYCVLKGSGYGGYINYLTWDFTSGKAKSNYDSAGSTTINNDGAYFGERIAYSRRNKDEVVFVRYYGMYSSSSNYTTFYTDIFSGPNGIFDRDRVIGSPPNVSTVPNALTVVGQDKVLFEFTTKAALTISLTEVEMPKKVDFDNISLPSGSRVFVDGAAYLWGKDIYLIFVGTGIIFSRTLEPGSFGYLDTTTVLGTITQFGYIDYDENEETLYILGQDTTNKVKLAKIVLNTLYDYANDGAWLPVIASDGVPAYIKAKGNDIPSGGTQVTVTVQAAGGSFESYYYVLFNGERLLNGKTYTRMVYGNSFTVGVEKYESTNYTGYLYVDGSRVVTNNYNTPKGTIVTETLLLSDYPTGVTLKGNMS